MRTWEIRDINGRNPRIVTLDQFKAAVAEAAARVKPVSNAFRRSNLVECAQAQATLHRTTK